ncbi:MAG: two-component sensor histidine kinase, partial [Alphaproteobacteria bacterium]|nr:two-component sensor histidine kinase [Alphaproteobacteria bacterium]
AHELRTPLAAMKTQTQVLRKKTGEKAGSDDGLQNLEASIDRAARLVDQLLALARLQNEDMPKVKVNLSECLQDCIADIQKMTQTKGHTLNVNIRDNVHLLGHEDSLAIMLKNFLENAVKYTPEGGTIDVSLSADGELSICDTGPGIPQAEQEKVFNKFYRADKTGKTGSGLGLSIAKWIADAHNLQISLANNKPQGLSVILKP